MKRIIALFIITFVFIASFNVAYCADEIKSIKMDVYINENGDAHITEIWDCYVEESNEKTETYHSYHNIGESTITNLKVVDEEGKEFETLEKWNINGSFNSKKYKCGFNYVTDGVEICWGISEFGNKKYTVSYDITKFVASLNDSDMVYWTLIPENIVPGVSSADITIRADKAFEDTLDVWGFGSYGDYCYVADGVIKFVTEDAMSSYEYVTILAKFPKGIFNTQNNISKDFDTYLNMAQDRKYKI